MIYTNSASMPGWFFQLIVFQFHQISSFTQTIQNHRKTSKAERCNYPITQGGGGWEERVTGAATLTKDYARKSYFIQIFDMQYCQQVGAALLCNTNCMLRKF